MDCYVSRQERRRKAYIVDLATGVYHSRETSTIEERLRGKRVYAHGYKRVLPMDIEARDCVLFNTMSMDFVTVSSWEKRENFVYPFSLLHMSADDSQLIIIIFGQDETGKYADEGVTMLCRVGDKEWTISEGGAQLLGASSYQGKIYGIGTLPKSHLQFFEVKLRPNYQVKVFEKFKVRQPSLKGSGDTRRYLVESCGELLFFHQDFAGDGYTNREANVVLDIRVFRINVKRMRSEEVEDLGDLTFFLSWSPRVDSVTALGLNFTGSGGFGYRASEFGFKKNTIYLVYVSS